jgi:hypothetical protein
MPTQSIISACITKFAALTASNFPSSTRPTLYFDDAPVVQSDGSQLAVTSTGYCVLKDEGQNVLSLGFERQTNEVCDFVIEVYYPSLGDVDTAVLAIKRNGGTAADGNGFDFGTLSDLASPRGTFEIVRTREQRGNGGLGKTGVPVHYCRLSYRVVVQESA